MKRMTTGLFHRVLTLAGILLLASTSFAAVGPEEMNAVPAANPTTSSGIDSTGVLAPIVAPTGANVAAQAGSPGLDREREAINPNLQEAMQGEFDTGTIDCSCPGSGFEVGDRVVALVNSPAGAPGILAGATGWVICGYSGSPNILVSWDGWTSGHNGNGFCECPFSNLLPQNSGWYVYCNEISILADQPVSCVCGAAYQTGDRVRATVDNPQGASGIYFHSTGTVVCGTTSGTPILLISWDWWSSGHNGNGYCQCPDVDLPNNSGWWVDCSDVELVDVDCSCYSQFKSGDRVTAYTADPQGAYDLPIRRGGTVVCGTTAVPDWMLISWDDWQNGHGGNGYCVCPVDSLPDSSGWWVACSDLLWSVNVYCACSASYDTGDRVELIVDNPDGSPTLYSGHQGTVICGNSSLPGWIFIAWDNWQDGWSGYTCDCPYDSLPDNSGWFVLCTDIVPAGTGPTDTVSASLTTIPGSGSLPFASTFTAQMGNLTTETRRAAGRINVVTGNGSSFNNWRSGWTNLSPSATFTTSWGQNFPASPVVLGNNVFTLQVQDVTPSPYNQPPYAPSGDTDGDVSTVTGY